MNFFYFKTIIKYLCVAFLFFVFFNSSAASTSSTLQSCDYELQSILQVTTAKGVNYICKKNIATVTLPSTENPTISFDIEKLPNVSQYTFYGLAAYYNYVHFLHITKNDIRKISEGESLSVNQNDWLAIAGRFKVILFKTSFATVKVIDHIFNLSWQNSKISPVLVMNLTSKSDLSAFNTEGIDLRYHHLWGWLGTLSKIVEWALVNIHQYVTQNWGWAIVIFALLVKLLLLPVSLITMRLQNNVSRYQTILAPQLAEIKSNYEGEEAHERMMRVYKTLGITPFYTLKPMLGALIQIPILIAIFNALGEMYQLDGAHFLWIQNLAYPDAILPLPFVIPFLGNTLNLLPIIMLVIALFSAMVYKNYYAPAEQVKRQKISLYFMAIVFFVLFYPFPAAMVLYWALANIFNLMQQFIKKYDR